MLWQLFISCFRVGAFTIGGGYAMLPVMKNIFVNEKKWVSDEEFVDMISVIQIVPGAIAINASIYLGHKLSGIPGAIAAALGSALPSFLIILLIASSLAGWYQSPYVMNFFSGIRPAVVGLILVAGIKLGRDILQSKLALILTFIFGVFTLWLKIHPALLIILGALLGIVLGKGGKEI
ncbi:MAG TPA: chromate transporter [Firmicutes bacterium]|nr:chromate transporter [Bacillota bacterium]